MLNLYDILTMTDNEIKHFLQWDAVNHFQYYPGEGNILLVAHIDTLPRKKVMLQTNNNVITNKHGLLGADDRAGVYAALHLHSTCHMPVLLTDYEETGGIGAKQAAEEMLSPNNIYLMIELDRKGCNEYVTYHDVPVKVHKYIQSFGYREDYGSYSDIADLSPAWKIPAVNLSVGYYNQHTSNEELHIDELNLTIQRVKQMRDNPPEKVKMQSSTVCELCGNLGRTKLVKGEYLCKTCQTYCLW